MEPIAPLDEKRRGIRRWWWVLPVFPVSLILLFVISNLLLSSQWSRDRIAGKIEHRIGLESRVGAINWSPWNGLTIHSLELLQPAQLRTEVPESFLKISKVKLTPIWQAWLRGRPEIQSIDLDTPRIVLPIELLSHLANSSPPQAPVVAPPAASAASPQPAATQPAPSVAPPPAASPPTTAAPPPPAPKLRSQPTGWVHLNNASFTLVHAASKSHLLDLSRISGSIPFTGDSAQSTLHFSKISAAGIEVIPQLTAALDWTRPRLSLKPLDIEILGYTCKLSGQLGMFGKLPIAIEAQLPRQPLKPIQLPLGGRASAEGISANGRFRGLLFVPTTWQGELVAESLEPSIHVANRDVKFDRGNSITALRGGTLSCVDARLISDELSLLGNATILANGRLAAAARIVSPPDAAEAIANRIFPDVSGARPITQLSTPQRVALDLEALGTISQIFLRLGKDGPIVNLNR